MFRICQAYVFGDGMVVGFATTNSNQLIGEQELESRIKKMCTLRGESFSPQHLIATKYASKKWKLSPYTTKKIRADWAKDLAK